MATRTLGTNGTTTLTAVSYLPGYNSGVLAADMATINNAIKRSLNVANPQAGGGYFDSNGILYLPDQRGMIKLFPGDFVGVDAYGWPIVVPTLAITYGSTSWTHS